MRYIGIDAGKLYQLRKELKKARKIFGLNEITSCYEAGRDAFWIHRYLLSCNIENMVVDSSSIEVSRRRKRPKTDRIDAKILLVKLMRYCAGEKKSGVLYGCRVNRLRTTGSWDESWKC